MEQDSTSPGDGPGSKHNQPNRSVPGSVSHAVSDAVFDEASSANYGDESRLVEIEIPSRVDLVAVVRMVVAAATNAVEALHGDRLDDLRWVTSEATTNAIQANLSADNGDGRVAIRCEVDEGFVKLAVKDEGPGMPEQYEVPDITHPDRLHIEGAFGVPLMERLSSACRFVSADTGTTVQMELYQ